MQHLWNPIVYPIISVINGKTLRVEFSTGKHCNGINVMKIPITFPFKTCPKICNKDLRSFVKADQLAFEASLVFEAWKTSDDQVDKSRGRPVGFIDTTEEAATKILAYDAR